jgi:UDP-N-acetylmuramate dehydrogenase
MLEISIICDVKSLRKLFNKINIDSEIIFDEPLYLHSTFKIGGNADAYVKVSSADDIINIKKAALHENIPLYPLGEGANVLFSDKGYRGIVLDTSLLTSVTFEGISGTEVRAQSGVKMSDLSEICVGKGLKGLESFYGMPGFVGGSIYMNARCYGVSVSDRIKSVTYIDNECRLNEYIYNENDFKYKISPFQNKDVIILDTVFFLISDSTPELRKYMFTCKEERKSKGHYLYPCAGSVFKNNREFGEPTGKLIDRLGLRGYSIGGAMVSDLHANIIVNKGDATEKDIKDIIDFVSKKVFDSFGFELEREVIYVDERGR